MLEHIIVGFVLAGIMLAGSEVSDEVEVEQAAQGWAAPASENELGIEIDAEFFSKAADEAAKY